MPTDKTTSKQDAPKQPPPPPPKAAAVSSQPKQSPLDELKSQINSLIPEFKKALPQHVSADKFTRVLLTLVTMTPDLVAANRGSLFAACMKAATDGLLLDGREAAIATFKNKNSEQRVATYMPMTFGILKKVRNSGELASLNPHVVYKNDEFEYWVDENGEHLKHRPLLGEDRGEPVYAYATAKTKDGALYLEVMSKAEIEQVRNSGRGKDSAPWTQWWGEMAKKSVIRRLSKRLPMSTDIDSTIHADDDMFNAPSEPIVAAEARPTSSRLESLIDTEVPEQETEAGAIEKNETPI